MEKIVIDLARPGLTPEQEGLANVVRQLRIKAALRRIKAQREAQAAAGKLTGG